MHPKRAFKAAPFWRRQLPPCAWRDLYRAMESRDDTIDFWLVFPFHAFLYLQLLFAAEPKFQSCLLVLDQFNILETSYKKEKRE